MQVAVIKALVALVQLGAQRPEYIRQVQTQAAIDALLVVDSLSDDLHRLDLSHALVIEQVSCTHSQGSSQISMSCLNLGHLPHWWFLAAGLALGF